MEFLDTLMDFMAWVWSHGEVKFLVGHIIFNAVVAGTVSMKTGDFVLAKFPEFLWKKVFPLTGVWAVSAFFGESINMVWIKPASWVLLEGVLVGDLLDNLKRLGIPIPDALTKVRLEQ